MLFFCWTVIFLNSFQCFKQSTKHISHCYPGDQSFWHTSIIFFFSNTAWRKRQPAASHTNSIDTTAEFSQTYLKYRVEGGRKCFLTLLACLPKIRWNKKKGWSYDATSLFECPSPYPTTYLFSPPLTRPPTPSHPPHPLLLIFPVSGPHPSPNVFWSFLGGGVNAITCNVKSPRVCSPSCSDHSWQMKVLCVRHTVPIPSNLPPLSEWDGGLGRRGL